MNQYDLSPQRSRLRFAFGTYIALASAVFVAPFALVVAFFAGL